MFASYLEMDDLRPYVITVASSDRTFCTGDIIWKSPDGTVNSVQGRGCIRPEEGDERTFNFKCESAGDWEVTVRPGEELCRKKAITDRI